MLQEARDNANAANKPHRARIVETKRRLRAQITDMPERFASATRSVCSPQAVPGSAPGAARGRKHRT